MGPLISQAQLDKTLNAVTQANNEKAKLIIGGKKPSGNTLEYGYFFEPTIYSNVKPEMFISQEEIFGPVLSVLKAENFDDALKLTNISKYGLAFSIYTNVSEKAEEFIKDVKAGVCHINLPTSYRDPALPLLGWENSGYGLPESGRFARDFFTRTKVIYKA
jgi:aldehyde dehydrogenase (NAD+)